MADVLFELLTPHVPGHGVHDDEIWQSAIVLGGALFPGFVWFLNDLGKNESKELSESLKGAAAVAVVAAIFLVVLVLTVTDLAR